MLLISHNTYCLSVLLGERVGGFLLPPAKLLFLSIHFHAYMAKFLSHLFELLTPFGASPYLWGPSIYMVMAKPLCMGPALTSVSDRELSCFIFFLEFMSFQGNSLVKYLYIDFIFTLLESCRNWKYLFPKPGPHPAG